MEVGQAQGAMMDTRGFRWRVRPPCAPGRSPGPGATPAGIGRSELRKRARAPPLDGSGRCPRPGARKSRGATYSVSGNDAGPAGRTPASPAVTQALAVNQHTRKLGVMIYDTLYHARCKALIGPFTCGIVWTIGNWPAPAAGEVVP